MDESVAALADLRAGRAEVRLGPATIRLGRAVVCLTAAGLETLAAAVTAVTGHLGRPPERRPFTGHLTLARLRQPKAAKGLVGVPFVATFVVDDVHLVRSRTRPSGAVYDVVASRALAGGPPGMHG